MSYVALFTHNDLDGCGCAVLCKSVYGKHLQTLKFCNYDNLDKELSKFLNEKEKDASQPGKYIPLLLLTDICPSDKLLNRLDMTDFLVGLFDHHKTKEHTLAKYDYALFDNTKCGTELIFDYLKDYPDNKDKKMFLEAKEWVQSISSWDLWKLDSPYRKRGEQLNTLCFFLGMEEFVNVFSKKINADKLPEYQNLLRHLERNKKEYIDKVIKEQLHHTEYCMCGFTGKTFKVLIASDYISDIGEAALADEDSEDLHYIAIVNPLNNTVSLRSRNNEDIDVAKIAAALGGGGHFHASGLQYPFKKNLKNKVFKLLNNANG